MELNKSGGVEVGFNMMLYGIKPVGQGRFKHRWNQWFETQNDRKLHLTHEKRAEAIHRMQIYFMENTDW